MNLCNLLNLVLFFVCCNLTYGQERIADFQNISTREGLTANTYNYFLYRDSQGFLWISSIEGLNRFDGRRVRQYGAGDGMIGKSIQGGFLEDKHQNLWFNTYLGLSVYLRHEDRIVDMPLVGPSGDTLSSSATKVIHLTPAQRLWLRVDEQLCYLELSTDSTCHCLETTTSGFDFYVSADAAGNPEAILASPWLDGAGIELYALRDTQLLRREVLLSERRNVRKVRKWGEQWVGISGNQLLALSGDRWPEQVVQIDSNRLKNVDFQYDSTGNRLYLTSRAEGLQRGAATIPFEPADNLGLRNQRPNNLWLDTSYLYVNDGVQGVYYRPLHQPPFRPLAGVGRAAVSTYIATADDWLYTYENGILRRIRITPSSRTEQTIRLPGGAPSVFQLQQNSAGELVVIGSKQLYIVDPRFHKIFQVAGPVDTEYRGYTQLGDGRQFVTTNTGLLELSKAADATYVLKPVPELTDYTGFYFYRLFATARNQGYFESMGEGLWWMQSKGEKLSRLATARTKATTYSLTPQRFQAAAYWLGTDEGLKVLSEDTIITRPTTEHEDLLTVTVHDIEEDARGYLWLTTADGLWNWRPATDELYRYYATDGLPSHEFSLYDNLVQLDDGTIAVATTKGFVTFRPEEVEPSRIRPHAHIEALLVNDTRRIAVPHFRGKIELSYQEDNLVFDPIPVTLFRPERAYVAYQLVGYDDQLQTLRYGERVRYARVPPGSYRFRAQAVDDNGNRSDWIEVPLRIRPPFWQTWWFIGLTIAGIGALGYALYRRRIAALRREEATKRQLVELELQAAENELKALRAQMNPHFLFNVMNSIKSTIIGQDTRRSVDYLSRLAKLLRMVLANSEKKAIALRKELEALQLYVELEALRFGDNFQYEVLLDQRVDTGFVRIPPLILQPFAENAIKHGLAPLTGTRRLKLHVYREGDFVLVELEDNGIGRARAKSSLQRTDHQSMGLDITRRRVQLADARNDFHFVDLTNAAGEAVGTRVVLRLYAPE